MDMEMGEHKFFLGKSATIIPQALPDVAQPKVFGVIDLVACYEHHEIFRYTWNNRKW